MMSSIPYKMLLILFLLSPLCGCSQSGNVVPVTGTVTIDGQPPVGATVNFTPTEGEQRTTSRGTIREDGRYELRLTSQQDGALIGKHLVQIRFAPTGDNPQQMKIPRQFNKRSELYAEVTSDGDNTFNFELSSK